MTEKSGVNGIFRPIALSLLVLLAYFSLQYALALLLIGPDGELSGFVLSVSILASAPVAIALALLLMKKRDKDLRIDSILRRPHLAAIPIWAGLTLATGALHIIVSLALERPLINEFMRYVYSTAGPLPLFLLAVIIAAPMFEELLFRGYLYESLSTSRLGPTGAIVITSLMWAGIHMQYGLFDITYIFVLGLVLGAARRYTNTLLMPFIMHALNNLVSVVIALRYLQQ